MSLHTGSDGSCAGTNYQAPPEAGRGKDLPPTLQSNVALLTPISDFQPPGAARVNSCPPGCVLSRSRPGTFLHPTTHSGTWTHT